MSEYEDSLHDEAQPDPVEPEAESDEPVYKLAEVRADGTAIVQLADGRMFPAKVKEGAAIRKNGKVTLDHEGEDKDGVPTNATVTGLAS